MYTNYLRSLGFVYDITDTFVRIIYLCEILHYTGVF